MFKLHFAETQVDLNKHAVFYNNFYSSISFRSHFYNIFPLLWIA